MKKIFIIPLIISVFTSLYAQQTIKSQGEVLINGEKLTKSTVIKLGDFIETKKNSKIRFNIGVDAFSANPNSKFSFKEASKTKTLNVIAGGVLAVFKKGDGNHQVKTPNMTAGIRGTGIFTEIKEGKTYFCTCYGKTELNTKHEHKTYESTYHSPVWIKDNGEIKQETKMIAHSDDELRTLEAMVGRKPEFDTRLSYDNLDNYFKNRN